MKKEKEKQEHLHQFDADAVFVVADFGAVYVPSVI